MGESQGPIESWNMATATLKRLSWLLDQSCVAAQNQKLVWWFNILRDIRRNLTPFMDQDKFQAAEEKFESLPSGWVMPNGRVAREHFSTVNKTLDEIYIIYIKTMKAKGLLMPKPIDNSKSILEM